MDLQEITPMVLCYNERENIDRCLQHLTWAKKVLILDESSTDGTLEICATFPNVQILTLEAGLTLAEKCNRGLKHADTPWILSIDSDYMITNALVEELKRIQPSDQTAAYRVSFKLAFFGNALPHSLYPPRSVLYRRNAAFYIQDGHAHRVQITGDIQPLQAPVIHDDRKSIGRWFHSQSRYAQEEATKISATPWSELPLQDRLRRMIIVAPFVVLIWTLFIKGMAWHGRSGLYYTLMRICAEIMLSLALLDRMLRMDMENK